MFSDTDTDTSIQTCIPVLILDRFLCYTYHETWLYHWYYWTLNLYNTSHYSNSRSPSRIPRRGIFNIICMWCMLAENEGEYGRSKERKLQKMMEKMTQRMKTLKEKENYEDRVIWNSLCDICNGMSTVECRASIPFYPWRQMRSRRF